MTQRINESLNQRIKESMNLANLIPHSFQKFSDPVSFLGGFEMQANSFEMQIKLSLQSRAFRALFVDNFPRSRPATAETETPRRRSQEPHYRKKQRVSCPRLSSPVNSHASEQLHFPAL